jgi:hypothetical protein
MVVEGWVGRGGMPWMIFGGWVRVRACYRLG